jgi:hypothetical protein
LAIELDDKATCDKVVNKTDKDACVSDIATALNDWMYCLKISTTNPLKQYDCLLKVAPGAATYAPCTYIANQETKGICYAKVGIELSEFLSCQTVPLKPVEEDYQAYLARDTCWITIAIDAKSSDLCDNIHDENTMEDCLDAT